MARTRALTVGGTVLAVLLAMLSVVLAPTAQADPPPILHPGDLLVGDSGNNRILVFPADGADSWTFAAGIPGITDVAVGRDGRVYAALGGALAAWTVDGQELDVEVRNDAMGVAVQPDGQLLITEPGNQRLLRGFVGIVDTDVLTDGSSDPHLPQDPHGVAVAPDGDLYVADRTDGLVRLASTGVVQSTATYAASADWVSVGPGGDVWVTDHDHDAVYHDGEQVTGGLADDLDGPNDIVATDDGLFIADGGNDRVLSHHGSWDALTPTDGSSLANPTGLAVVPDPGSQTQAGDVFVADPRAGRVLRFPAGGGSPLTVGSGLRSPQGVAVDDDGNVYIADQPDHEIDVNDPPEGRLVRVSADGLTQTVLADALYVPWGIAVDDDHVYVSDFSFTGGVFRMDHDGGNSELVDTGALFPAGLALDPEGDLFVADPFTNTARRVPADGSPSTELDAGVSFPWDVATDAAGDVIFAGGFEDTSVLVPGGDGTPEPIGPAHQSPYAAAVTADGRVLVADAGLGAVASFDLDTGDPGDSIGAAEFPAPGPDQEDYQGPYDVAVFAPKPSLTSSAPDDGTIGSAYSFENTADQAGATYALVDGYLPDGLALSSTGVLSGTPSAAGDFTFEFRVGNAATARLVSQTVTIAKIAQSIVFTSTAPAHAVSGGSYVPTATGGASGNPVVFTVDATPDGACEIVAGTVSFLHPGSCTVRANQAGGPDYLAAGEVTQTIDVGRAALSISFTSTAPGAPVVGETYTPSVRSDPDAGAVRLTTHGGCGVAGATITFDHAGQCTVVATVPGDADHSSASAVQTIQVAKASTVVEVRVEPHRLVAGVDVVAPGAGRPTGEVSFTVDGIAVGTERLVDGVVALSFTLDTGADHVVVATYAGADDFDASSDSAERRDPELTASLTSRSSPSHGWYRRPVTVRFTCTAATAALSGPCPAPVRVAKETAGRTVARTITALDGGRASAARVVRIDLTGPTLRVVGPELRCVAEDALSGMASCHLTKHRRGDQVRFKAVAVDLAGNRTVVRGRR